jgi:O-antigen ligase
MTTASDAGNQDPGPDPARASSPGAERAAAQRGHAVPARVFEPAIAAVPFLLWFVGGSTAAGWLQAVAYAAVGAMLVFRPALGLLALVPLLPFHHPRPFQPHGPMVLLAVVAVGSVGARLAVGRLTVLATLRPAVWLTVGLLAATTFQLFLGVSAFGGSIPLAALSQYDQTLILLSVLGVALVVLPGQPIARYVAMAFVSLAIVAAVAIVHFVEPEWLASLGLGWLVRPDTLNYRASGVIASANFLGFAMASGAAWLLVRAAWLLRDREAAISWQPWAFMLATGAGVLLAFTMLLTFSRAALVGLVAAVLVALARSSPRAAIGAVGAVVVVAVLAYPLFVDARLGRTFGVNSPRAQAELAASDEQRAIMARAAIDAFLDAPIAGHGFSTFSTISPAYSGQSELTSAHNQYLKVAAEQGLIGIALYLGLIAALVVPVWRAGPGPWIASLAVAGVFAVVSLTADSMSSAQAASGTFFFLAVGAVEAAGPREASLARAAPEPVAGRDTAVPR